MNIKKNKPLSAALDCDDVLFPCMQKAIDICNEKYKFNPPLDINEVDGWLPNGSRVDIILECFSDPDFFKDQKPYKEAQRMVRELSKMCVVYILTAVPILASSIRGEIILKFFPEIDKDNIIITSSKDVVHIDILLDDKADNILTSPAKYTVLMRRPWNRNMTGVLSVNNYDEFLFLVNQIKNRYIETPFEKDQPCAIALVGPSGSGKTVISDELITKFSDIFERPKAYTTRNMRINENENSYNFVSENEFNELKESGEIFESTVYSGNYYGSSKNEIEKVLKSGKNVILPLDMCGAIGLKSSFKNTIIVYVDRHKRQMLTSVLERNTTVEDKVNRIISIAAEEKNSELCDYIISNNYELNDAIEQILSIIN
jgi:guanylate kinase